MNYPVSGIQELPAPRVLRDGENTYLAQSYTKWGPLRGLGLLAWSLAGPKREPIEVPPLTDVLIKLSDGDYTRFRLENPAAVRGRGSTHQERKKNNEQELRWSMTNVGMQAGPSGPRGIELPLKTIKDTELLVGEPITLAAPGGTRVLQSKGVIEEIVAYDRTRPVGEVVAASNPETPMLRNFRIAIAVARAALMGAMEQQDG